MLKNIENAYKLFKDVYNKDTEMLDIRDLEPIENKFRETNYYSADVPRIMFLGEFKAGKSTLLNALFGRNIAATDIFEMTAWLARYWYSENEFCKITLKDKNEIFMSPEEFYTKCSNRTLENVENIEIVDVGINNSDINYSIVDAPGFGSITSENESLSIDGIKEADIVFWILSCEAIGGMKEAAIIKEVMASGMPVVCVITKCDYCDYDEIKEIEDYIRENFGIANDKIFPVSAKEYMENQGNQKEQDNMKRLISFIKNNVVTRKNDLRKQAQEGYIQILNDHCLSVISKITKSIEARIDSSEKYSALLETLEENINLKAENMLIERVRNNLYEPYRSKIVMRIGSLSGKIKEKDIENIFVDVLPPNYLDNFWNELAIYLQEYLMNEWKSSLQERIDEIAKFRSDLFANSGRTDIVVNINEELERNVGFTDDNVVKTGIATTLGVAGIAVLYEAVLGTAAAYITVGMAATGIGIPIALMGLGVTAALKFFNKNKKNSQSDLDGNSIVMQNVEYYIEEIIKKGYIQKVKGVNENYRNMLKMKNESDLCKKLPVDSLEEMMDLLNDMSKKFKK